jgi:heme exporter protein D
MKWESWSDFFAMGGYGLYVWGSYLVALLCILGESLLVRSRRRTLHKHLGLKDKSSLRGRK